MTTQTLHSTLLRPAILQILRAQGFHAAKPSVIDTLTSIVSNYLLLVSSRTYAHALSNHNEHSPTITDLRMALMDCGLLTPTQTSSEEVWRELLRRPLGEIGEENGLREKERVKREREDLGGIKGFVEWISAGEDMRETKRIAGFSGDDLTAELEMGGVGEVKVDYVTAMKNKHGKVGDESRFAGTVMGSGKEAELRPVVIEGGPMSIEEWQESRIGGDEASPGLSSDDDDEPLALHARAGGDVDAMVGT